MLSIDVVMSYATIGLGVHVPHCSKVCRQGKQELESVHENQLHLK